MQYLILVILSSICLVALFIVVGLLFPKRVEKSMRAGKEMPGRSFLLGLVNTLFIAALILGFTALSEATGAEFISIFVVILMMIYVIIFTFGLTSMVQTIGLLFAPNHSPQRQFFFGAVILILACLTPFIGWFGFFPYIGLTGVGAFVIASYKGKNKVEPETG